jgi:hypothetical protein
MALTDIQEKQSEERKREKRLVHFTNALNRDFLSSNQFKGKGKIYKTTAEYTVKSFLDYLFFDQHKEIRELTGEHIESFLLDFVPRRLTFTLTSAKYVPDILSKFLIFMEASHHIHNGSELSTAVKDNSRAFLKAVPAKRKRSVKKPTTKKTTARKTTKPVLQKVGRNDPCPCGSGKKYKKCCGRPK